MSDAQPMWKECDRCKARWLCSCTEENVPLGIPKRQCSGCWFHERHRDSDHPWPTFRQAKRAFESAYVRRTLEMAGGNVSRAARIAGKDRKDFYDVMKRNGVERGESQ